MIRLYHVTMRYSPHNAALIDVTFSVEKGEFVFLSGPSGAGKTTLLKLIFREELPTEGQVVVNGKNIAALPPRRIPFLRRNIGVVFQDFKLLGTRTIMENVRRHKPAPASRVSATCKSNESVGSRTAARPP